MKLLGLLLLSISIAVISTNLISINPIVNEGKSMEIKMMSNETNSTASDIAKSGMKRSCHCPCRWAFAHGNQNTQAYIDGCINDGTFDTYVCDICQ